MDLIWSSAGDLFVAGPDTVAYLHATQPGRTLTGPRFAPGVAPIALGVSAQELAGGRRRLDELWPASDVRQVVDRLVDSQTPGRELEALAPDALSWPFRQARRHVTRKRVRRKLKRRIGIE